MPFPNDPSVSNPYCSNSVFWVGDPAGMPEEQFLNLRAAWAITTGDPSVKVAIICNGNDWNQTDIPEKNFLGYNFVDSNNNTSANCSPYYCVSGTEATSIICSKTNNNSGIFGIAGGWNEAPGITPVIYKFIQTDIDDLNTFQASQSNISFLIASLNAAVAVGAKVILLPFNINSVTLQEQNDFIDAVTAILSEPCNQLTIITAAGNWMPGSQYTGVLFPGTFDPIITVGGVDNEHFIYINNDGGSCYGQHLDFVTSYISSVNTGNPCLQNNFNQYDCERSTLVSAAQLAGVVALMYSVNPNLRHEEVFEILKQSCYKTGNYTDYDANGWSPHVGYGFPNAKIAVELARDYIGTPVTSGTWNTNQIKGSFTIESGTTLTLSGMTLSMLPGAIITIKPGGKLIVNSSTITNACPNRVWKGINVWGNTAANQYPDVNSNYQQGYLELNNSTIENAICATNLWKPGDYTKTGGILKADNSTFRNNTNAIHACNYKNTHPLHPNTEVNYSGTCTRCKFEITTAYIPEKTFYKHVDIAEIKGFSFLSCDFSLAKNVQGVSEWNQAIAAYSAGVNVNALCNGTISPCENYDRSTFTGFQWGINVKITKPSSNTLYVNRADFIDNIYGIYVNDVDYETVINCNFQVGYNPGNGNCTNNASYGIYLEGSSGFAIEDNQFSKLSGAPTSVYNGILVSNCESVDQIYRNTFTGLSYANLAQLKNWKTIDEGNFTQGLTYFCNTNNNNFADFYVLPDGLPEVISGISDGQGSDFEVAGNKFSQAAYTRWHFYNGGDYRVGYYYNASQAIENPDDNKEFYVTDKAKQLSNSCPSHYGGSGGISIVLGTAERAGKELEYAQALTNYNAVKSLFDNLKDGGSTTQTLNDIETAQPQDMWALRSELLGASPHLSIEVLKAVANRTDVFPHSAIFDILAANPDELRKNELLDYLTTTTDPLPEYMINILRSVAEGSSYKTILLNQMAQYNHIKTNAANDIIRSILNSDETDYNDLRNWLDNLGGPVADRQIIATYLQQNNYTAALNLATMQPQLYAFNAAEIAANNALIQLISLYQTLYNESRQLDALNQTEKDMLTGIAELYPSEACVIARGILSAYYGETYNECFSIPETAAYKKGQLTPEICAQIYGMKIEVNPNPATTWAAFDYRLPDFESAGLLEITDIAGHVLLSIELHDVQGQYLLDTRAFAGGMYLYTLTSGKARKTGKLTIIK